MVKVDHHKSRKSFTIILELVMKLAKLYYYLLISFIGDIYWLISTCKLPIYCCTYCLFRCIVAKPLLVWNTFAPYGAALVYVQWIETCPGLFLVQDSLDTLYMWWVCREIGTLAITVTRAVVLYKMIASTRPQAIPIGMGMSLLTRLVV